MKIIIEINEKPFDTFLGITKEEIYQIVIKVIRKAFMIHNNLIKFTLCQE